MSNVKFKNPNAPATDKQVAFYNVLAAERGLPTIPAFIDGTTVKDASEAIDALKELPKAKAPSLTDMAAAIASGTQIPAAAAATATSETELHGEDDLEAQPAIMLAFDREECKALKSALSCLIGETDGTPLDFQLCDKIDAFLEAKPTLSVAQETVQAAQHLPATKHGTDVPAGHYALKAADGTFDFYKVDHGKSGTQWDGFVFLSKQAGDDFQPVKPAHGKAAILKQIAANPLEAAKAYGHELGVCGICHKTLTDPESIAAGIGPVCASKF